MRANYWSCSKFADWLRGTPKLEAGTSREWHEWKKSARSRHPWRYWLAEEALGKIQDFIAWPADKINDIRYYINNRWISRSHGLTAHPRDIRPGEWQDLGHRFLPCMFNELVDFVEVETAWHHCAWDEEARKKYNTPWTRRFFRFRTWRSMAAGIDHLEWASGLTNAEFLEDHEKHRAEPTHQARAAQEILELYRWWTVTRPARPDAHEISGWTALCAARRHKHGDIFLGDEEESEREKTRQTLDVLSKIEQQYEDEDEAMMIRLIKIRQSLWT